MARHLMPLSTRWRQRPSIARLECAPSAARPGRPLTHSSFRTTVTHGAPRGEKAGFWGQVDVGVRQARWIVKRLTTFGSVAIVSEWTEPRAFSYFPVPPVIAESKGPWS